MDSKERAALIRKGNEHFNRGELDRAEKIFRATGYRDGLTRIGDYFYYEKKLPLVALTYYRLVNHRQRIEEIYERMIFALGKLIRSDDEPARPRGEEEKKGEEDSVRVPVHPKLKILAREILREQGEEVPEGTSSREDNES
jgi:hypothetical protein